MEENARSSAYRTYIVRVWPEQTDPQTPKSWRAQVIDVRTGKSRSFKDPIKLVTFLYSEDASRTQN